jgi:hypothetical protein
MYTGVRVTGVICGAGDDDDNVNKTMRARVNGREEKMNSECIDSKQTQRLMTKWAENAHATVRACLSTTKWARASRSRRHVKRPAKVEKQRIKKHENGVLR